MLMNATSMWLSLDHTIDSSGHSAGLLFTGREIREAQKAGDGHFVVLRI